MNNFDIEVQYAVTHKLLPAETDIKQWVTMTIGDRMTHAELTVRLVDESESTQLNESFRHKQGSTNVLSFPVACAEEIGVPLLGDIAICAQVVEREATDQNKEIVAHYAHMVVHGVLHLLGYDHIESGQAERMEKLETEILGQLGYPDPYQCYS
ncbi:MAG TPA: rRNA maturation RNase YbeY [Gammaproteobacteria bacterium]|nr:rRNA maturation RNase YbeY [Gammaproteobacteria bacterium]